MKAKTCGLAFVFLFFLVGGIGHFAATDFFVKIVPPYIPQPRLVVYASGVVEVLLAAGLWMKNLRALTGWLLIGLICGVSLANIFMWQHPDKFPETPEWALTLRLVLQLGLIWLTWWCTRPNPASEAQP